MSKTNQQNVYLVSVCLSNTKQGVILTIKQLEVFRKTNHLNWYLKSVRCYCISKGFPISNNTMLTSRLLTYLFDHYNPLVRIIDLPRLPYKKSVLEWWSHCRQYEYPAMCCSLYFQSKLNCANLWMA